MAVKVKIEDVVLDMLRKRITRVLPGQVRACLKELNEEQIWWRPNEQSNSVGNLVLHLCGSTRHYLTRGIGGIEYERNRAAEFAARGPLPKQQLLSLFDETVRQATLVLDSFNTARFLDPTEEPDYYGTILEQILGVAVHFATHTGQIIHITKTLKPEAVDELWIKAHRKR